MRSPSYLLAAIISFALLTACGPSPSPIDTERESSPSLTPSVPTKAIPAAGPGHAWEELVQLAEQEGKVAIYGPPGKEWRDFLTGAFAKAHPKIKVEYFGLGGAQSGPRILSEQQAGVFSADLLVGGTTTPNQVLLPGGALAPITPLLALPEVTDTSKWWQGRHLYSDAENRYHLLFQGSVSSTITFNTKLVNHDELQSFRDLLDPKWRGKMVTWDPRRPGPSSANLRFYYHNPRLGPDFIRDLYTVTDIVVSINSQQMVDWIAQGRYPIGLNTGGDVDTAKRQGLPIDQVRRPLKEGERITAGFGGVALLRNAPHPNAAKVYVNWLLSREGQTAFQELVGENSLRMDVPKEKLLRDKPGIVPQAGVDYFFPEQAKYILDQKAESEIRRIVNEALVGR